MKSWPWLNSCKISAVNRQIVLPCFCRAQRLFLEKKKYLANWKETTICSLPKSFHMIHHFTISIILWQECLMTNYIVQFNYPLIFLRFQDCMRPLWKFHWSCVWCLHTFLWPIKWVKAMFHIQQWPASYCTLLHFYIIVKSQKGIKWHTANEENHVLHKGQNRFFVYQKLKLVS